ncbi:DUF805 domain-containing protein [bacterium]|nr:DUF805 domain-containing protein [bacterium]
MKKQVKKTTSVLSVAAFSQAIRNFFTGYIDFNGRAARYEFWYAFLFVVVVNAIFGGLGIIGSIIGWLLFIPMFMVTVRRYRDAGINPLVYVIPFAVIVLWGIIRGGAIVGMLSVGVLPTDATVFGILGFVWMVANVVICCLPSRK